jgi:hypothetical protein
MLLGRSRALLDKHGVQIRILGRRDLLPPDVQVSCARAEALTANNTKCVQFHHLPSCCFPSQPSLAMRMDKKKVEGTEQKLDAKQRYTQFLLSLHFTRRNGDCYKTNRRFSPHWISLSFVRSPSLFLFVLPY